MTQENPTPTRRLRQRQIRVPIDRAISLDDIMIADRQAGGHFFDKAAMRGFRSRIVYDSPKVGADKRTIYFITSEQFKDSSGVKDPREYNVRAVTIDDDGDLYIRTMKGGGGLSLRGARRFMASDECP